MPLARSACRISIAAAFGGIADRDDGDRGRGRRGCVHQHGQALDPGGPADGGGQRAAHFGDQPVVAAAGHDGALGAELGGDELERGVAVVVEAADDARVFPEWDAEADQVLLQLVVEGSGRVGQVGVDGRRVGDDAAVGLVLAVQDAHRVAAPAGSRLSCDRAGLVFGEIGDQGVAVGVAAVLVAEGVQFQHRVVGDFQRLQDVPAAGDDLGVGQRFGGADQFGADLVELAVAALLRALVAEHRAGVEHLLRQRLGQPVGHQRAAYAGGAFGPQGDGIRRRGRRTCTSPS